MVGGTCTGHIQPVQKGSHPLRRWSTINKLSTPDFFFESAWRVGEYTDELQGESPRDRAWPTEGGNEPIPEKGWDPSGTFRPDVVRQVYEELVRAGKIHSVTSGGHIIRLPPPLSAQLHPASNRTKRSSQSGAGDATPETPSPYQRRP